MAQCAVDECDRPARTRNLCDMHYKRWTRTGTTDGPTLPASNLTTCTVHGCSRNAVGRGWCELHYARWKRHGHPLAVEKARHDSCTIDGCDLPHLAKGMCSTHYARVKRNGDLNLRPMGKERRPGYAAVDGEGRRHIYTPEHILSRSSGLVAEHRLVLFDAIGFGPHRCHWCDKWVNWGWPISCRLDVDHIDWDVSNNDRANLVPSCHKCNSHRQRRSHPHAPPGGSMSLSAQPWLSSAVSVDAHRK